MKICFFFSFSLVVRDTALLILQGKLAGASRDSMSSFLSTRREELAWVPKLTGEEHGISEL